MSSAAAVKNEPGSQGSWLLNALQPPSYGFVRDGAFYKPTNGQLFRELIVRLNVFATRKNWVAAWSWFTWAILAVPLLAFFFEYRTWPGFFAGALYGLCLLGAHGTVYYHRYSTHRAFKFSNSFARFIVKNMMIKLIVEEAYVVSHHVHHLISEQPGDPYNVNGGFWYCFLADANHQGVNRDLDEKGYLRLTKLLEHTGIRANTYEQYQRWGSVANPAATVASFAINWVVWYAILYAIGGNALATAIFGGAFVWAFGIRTFNYDGHGAGEDKRRDGIDFNREDLSINQVWPGYVAGEWHNNHHLYPNGARSGFLPYQLDIAWLFIRFYYAIGGVSSFRDPKEQFYREHYEPWLAAKAAREAAMGAPCESPKSSPPQATTTR
jgi:fatty-acid desaturase